MTVANYVSEGAFARPGKMQDQCLSPLQGLACIRVAQWMLKNVNKNG